MLAHVSVDDEGVSLSHRTSLDTLEDAFSSCPVDGQQLTVRRNIPTTPSSDSACAA